MCFAHLMSGLDIRVYAHNYLAQRLRFCEILIKYVVVLPFPISFLYPMLSLILQTRWISIIMLNHWLLRPYRLKQWSISWHYPSCDPYRECEEALSQYTREPTAFRVSLTGSFYPRGVTVRWTRDELHDWVRWSATCYVIALTCILVLRTLRCHGSPIKACDTRSRQHTLNVCMAPYWKIWPKAIANTCRQQCRSICSRPPFSQASKLSVTFFDMNGSVNLHLLLPGPCMAIV